MIQRSSLWTIVVKGARVDLVCRLYRLLQSTRIHLSPTEHLLISSLRVHKVAIYLAEAWPIMIESRDGMRRTFDACLLHIPWISVYPVRLYT